MRVWVGMMHHVYAWCMMSMHEGAWWAFMKAHEGAWRRIANIYWLSDNVLWLLLFHDCPPMPLLSAEVAHVAWLWANFPQAFASGIAARFHDVAFRRGLLRPVVCISPVWGRGSISPLLGWPCWSRARKDESATVLLLGTRGVINPEVWDEREQILKIIIKTF